EGVAVQGTGLPCLGQPGQEGGGAAPVLVPGGRTQVGGDSQSFGEGGEFVREVAGKVGGVAGPPGPCVSRSRIGGLLRARGRVSRSHPRSLLPETNVSRSTTSGVAPAKLLAG